MPIIWKALALAAVAAPLFAGALTLEVSNPDSNLEALKNNAVAVVRTTACVSPEKTRIAATAEGIVDGRRRSIPLNLAPLREPGTFAVAHAWPARGKWVIRFTATNPDYGNYTTGALIAIHSGSPDWKNVQRIYHAPTAAEIDAALSGE